MPVIASDSRPEKASVTAVNQSKPAAQDTNRRTAQRKTALLRGKIVFDDGAGQIDCMIRDFSDFGARIDLAGGQIVPTHVFLLVARDSTAYEAEVRWRNPKQMGLFFSQRISLLGRVPDRVSYLKQLLTSFHVTARPAKPVEITPEMVCAGLAAYSGWKARNIASLNSEEALVRTVFAAMQRVMPSSP